MATHYQQKNIDDYNANPNNTGHLEESVNRTLPQFKMDGKLIFERDMGLLADGYTQTLEPRMQYLYVPYRDQAIFKTTTLLYCSLTTAACSVIVLTAVWTVSPPLTS